MVKGPLLIDSLDRPNTPVPGSNPKPTTIKSPFTEKVMIVLIAVITALIVLGLYFIYDRAAYSYQFGTDSEAAIGSLGLAAVYLIVIGFIVSVVTVSVRYLWNYSQRARLVNIMEHQTTIDGIPMDIAAVVAEVYRVRAANSMYQGVQTLTEGDKVDNVTTNAVAQPTAPTAPDVLSVLPKGNDGTVLAMQKAGLTRAESLLIGFEADDSIPVTK